MPKGSFITKVPLSIPSNVLWLDANDPAGDNTQPANSSALATWVDKSGSGNNAVQATGGNQPTFLASQFGNLPAISFNGTSSFMATGTNRFSSGSVGRTIFIVTKATTLNGYVFTYGTNAGSQYFSTALIGNTFFADLNTNSAHYTGSLSTATNYILETNYTAGSNINTVSLKSNGTALSVTGDAVAPNTVIGTSNIGQLLGNTARYSGIIAEIIMYNRALTTAEAILIRQYLANKWGITTV